MNYDSSSISSLSVLPSPWRGAGDEALFPSLCDATPFTLPRKVNGVTTRFDVDYMVKWVKLQRNLRQITMQTDMDYTNSMYSRSYML